MPNQRTRARRKNVGEPLHKTAEWGGEKLRLTCVQSSDDVNSPCIYVSNCSASWLMSTVTGIFCTCNTFTCTKFTCHAAIGAERLSNTEVLIQFSSLERARGAFKIYFEKPRAERCCWHSEEASKELQRNLKFYCVQYDLYTFVMNEFNEIRKVTHKEHLIRQKQREERRQKLMYLS